MGLRIGAMLTLILLGLGCGPQASGQVGRNEPVYNLSSGVGLKGFDPVSVFPEGGGVVRQGLPEVSFVHAGVTYYFSSEDHREFFRQDPEKYEPTYGGWCAYAMASGSQVDIQPQFFTIADRRAHYFVSARAKRSFDSDIGGYENRADTHWLRISGEHPRR